jgi:uncharacterized membrane protein
MTKEKNIPKIIKKNKITRKKVAKSSVKSSAKTKSTKKKVLRKRAVKTVPKKRIVKSLKKKAVRTATRKRVAKGEKKAVFTKKRAGKRVVRKSPRAIARKENKVSKNINRMRTANFSYLITAVFELVMAIPFLGWMVGISSFGIMWLIGIVINVVAIVALINRKKPIYANIVAVVANAFGVVPFLGWALHFIAVIMLFILFFKEEQKSNR